MSKTRMLWFTPMRLISRLLMRCVREHKNSLRCSSGRSGNVSPSRTRSQSSIISTAAAGRLLIAQGVHAGAETEDRGRLCRTEKGGIALGVRELGIPVIALGEKFSKGLFIARERGGG
jgi:hypothetical protein